MNFRYINTRRTEKSRRFLKISFLDFSPNLFDDDLNSSVASHRDDGMDWSEEGEGGNGIKTGTTQGEESGSVESVARTASAGLII